jgi:purine-binding chemotaxis protein CheW
MECRLPTFIISEEHNGGEVRYTTEVAGIQSITEAADSSSYFSGMPNSFKGVISLKGKDIPVGDVRLYLGAEERPYDDLSCIIVLNVDDQLIGLIVDRVFH